MKPPQTAIRPVSDQLYEVVDLDIEDLSRLRLWIFDLEASGLDTTHERITQVAGIPIEGGRILEEQAFTAFVNPGPDVEISQEVQDLTGITPAMLVDAPSLPKVGRTAWRPRITRISGSARACSSSTCPSSRRSSNDTGCRSRSLRFSTAS